MKKTLIDSSPVGIILPAVLFFNLIISGVFASYMNIPQVYWITLVALLLFLFFKGDRLNFVSGVVWAIYIAFSWFFLTDTLSLKFVAIKDYIIPVVIILLVPRINFNEEQLRFLLKFFQCLIFFQIPFLLHQRFIVAYQSDKRVFDWDLITGTFGFNPSGGGGNSAGLLLFVCYIGIMTIEKIRLYVSNKSDYMALITCVFIVFMIEAKIVVVLLFFVFFALFRKEDIVDLKTILKYLLIAVIFLTALLNNYNDSYSSGTKEGRDLDEYITDMYESYTSEYVINYETSEVGRSASFMLWYEGNIDGGVNYKTLIGHGLTSSKYTNSNNVEAASFGSYINFASTQMSIYLWDVGVVGCLILMCYMFSLLFGACMVKPSGGYGRIFRTGRVFLALSFCLYPFYTNIMHINSIAFTLFVVFLLVNSRPREI
jgi:hypothetical protein